MSSLRRPHPTAIKDYLRVAPFYDRLATTYSLGAIDRSRLVHLQHLAPQSRLLYVGGGSGQEAMLAAQQGHEVQIWDPSAAMLDRARQNRQKLDASAQARITLVQAPAQDLDAQETFDAIVANYFLNLFAPQEIPWWLDRLGAHLRPDASLWIADFAPLRGWSAPLAFVYHALPLVFFRLWTGNAAHNPYDYAKYLRDASWRLTLQESIALTRWGPAWFACWQAKIPDRAALAGSPGSAQNRAMPTE